MKYGLYFLIIFSVLSSLWLVAEAQTCQSEVGGYCADLAALPYAQISGLEFLGLPADATIGVLISRLYTFGVGLAALAAFIMFTVGGIAYLTAGDNESQVTKARGFMKNAVFGLALALLSWLILFTINPDLVKTLDLKLEPIKGGAKTESLPTSQEAQKQFGNVLGETVTPINGQSAYDACAASGGTPAKVLVATGQFAVSSQSGAYCITTSAQPYDGKCVQWARFRDFNTGKDLGKYCLKK